MAALHASAVTGSSGPMSPKTLGVGEAEPNEFNLDAADNDLEADDGDILVGHLKGHTKNDQRDMDRMGKRQELIVCWPRSPFRSSLFGRLTYLYSECSVLCRL